MSKRKNIDRNFKGIEVRGKDGVTYKAFVLPKRDLPEPPFTPSIGEAGEGEASFRPFIPGGEDGDSVAGAMDGPAPPAPDPDADSPEPGAEPAAPAPGEPVDPAAVLEAAARKAEAEAEAARVAALEQTAREEGFRKGEAEGFEAGRIAGEELGFKEGVARGEKEGLEAGFAKGELDGFEAAKVEAERKLGALGKLMEGLDELWPNLIRANEAQIVALVGKVAEKVVGRVVETDNEVVKRAILQAFDTIPEPVEVTIRVCPEDYEYIEIVKEDFFREIKELKQVTVVSDPSVSRGGCRIETVAGEVDGTLESRVEAVLAALGTL